MKQYTVKTRFKFEGLFFVKAKNKMQAREYVNNHCGLVLNRGIHSSLSDEVVDWNFPVHPEKSIKTITQTQEEQ